MPVYFQSHIDMSNDHSYKLLFSFPEMVKDLLTGFVKGDWLKQCNFDSLEKVSGSYISDDLRSREDDLIWRLKWGDEWIYIYLLLEFQSTTDHFMAVRILSYIALLYQDIIRADKLKRGDKLPPVLPIVLYNGQPRWVAPVSLESLIHPSPSGLEKYRPAASYLLIDEGTFDNNTLSDLNNLVAALFQLENSRTDEDIRAVLVHLIGWLKTPEQTNLRRAFTVWINRVLLPAKASRHNDHTDFNDLHEVQTMLEERVKEWTKTWKMQGLEQGIEQGIEQGMEQGIEQGVQLGEARALHKLVQLKFSNPPEWVEQKINQADKADLERWIERILTAESIEQLFASDDSNGA